MSDETGVAQSTDEDQSAGRALYVAVERRMTTRDPEESWAMLSLRLRRVWQEAAEARGADAYARGYAEGVVAGRESLPVETPLPCTHAWQLAHVRDAVKVTLVTLYCSRCGEVARKAAEEQP